MTRQINRLTCKAAAGIALLALWGLASAANVACFQAQITRVGQVATASPETNSGVRIEVEGGSCGFEPYTPFFLSYDLGNAGLAIALTAFSTGSNVTLILPDPPVANSLVFKMHADLTQ